jgi:hypothetical protein
MRQKASPPNPFRPWSEPQPSAIRSEAEPRRGPAARHTASSCRSRCTGAFHHHISSKSAAQVEDAPHDVLLLGVGSVDRTQLLRYPQSFMIGSCPDHHDSSTAESRHLHSQQTNRARSGNHNSLSRFDSRQLQQCVDATGKGFGHCTFIEIDMVGETVQASGWNTDLFCKSPVRPESEDPPLGAEIVETRLTVLTDLTGAICRLHGDAGTPGPALHLRSGTPRCFGFPDLHISRSSGCLEQSNHHGIPISIPLNFFATPCSSPASLHARRPVTPVYLFCTKVRLFAIVFSI